ncbi:MAG TPA: triose-phosphate isomerase [Bacteroidales bacterium]|jgi:triosephosphate isomerase|nr:triose-phosphate isomerase [Bacteroidales bacterium]HOS57296.1 triose-phosphate isomerase [Bacteroidales bacterium]HRR03882.1 triose-phosphate isomerase [Bacteroidales bacterium]HXK74153.1 triose-phosphate isomerase [Bacteroidales bacterium]
MKNKLVIGNWKMNLSFEEANDLIIAIGDALEGFHTNSEVVLSPSFVYLELATDLAEEYNFSIAAQNCSEYENGAYTGEISASMLAALKVNFCIVGHSERRKYFHETNETIAKKVDLLHKQQLIPIVCCGETMEERKNNEHFKIVEQQLVESLFHLNKEMFGHVIIAYEPVWAIGTGETATPEQAQEMHAFIRSLIEKKYGAETAYNAYILYGGSCNAKNALNLFMQPDIDGGLIGGASLKTSEFIAIIEAADSAAKDN